jgi:hypothetical protein
VFICILFQAVPLVKIENMDSVFDPAANAAIIARVQKLNFDSKPLWGKMTVAQMVTHAQQPMKVALGELNLKRGLIGILLGGWAKKKLLAPEPWKPGMRTADEFVVDWAPEFEAEKQNLMDLFQEFVKRGPEGITKEPHPFFGKLTLQEWDQLQMKHMDHHLRQFGV